MEIYKLKADSLIKLGLYSQAIDVYNLMLLKEQNTEIII